MIALAQPVHLEAINRIYNQAVHDGFRTAHDQPVDMNYRKEWFDQHSESHYPIWIYSNNDTVLGWISLSAYRPGRKALNEVVEVSYYVDYEHHGQGIATRLMKHAITFCKDQNYRIVVAILLSQNAPSIQLLRNFNFEEGGRIPHAYRFRGEFRDHLYMFKRLDLA